MEDGAWISDDPDFARRIRRMRDYGKGDDGEDMAYVGLSARMSELNAAIGMANFAKVTALVRHRGRLVALYRKLLQGLPGIRFQRIPENVSPSHNYMVIFVDGSRGVARDELYDRLKENGIQTKRYFSPAVHEMTAYRRLGRKYLRALPVAEKAAREGLALPLYGDLKAQDVEYICSRIREVFDR